MYCSWLSDHANGTGYDNEINIEKCGLNKMQLLVYTYVYLHESMCKNESSACPVVSMFHKWELQKRDYKREENYHL